MAGGPAKGLSLGSKIKGLDYTQKYRQSVRVRLVQGALGEVDDLRVRAGPTRAGPSGLMRAPTCPTGP
eukprot:2495447-Alexandrium_andersonii.AAC.1